MGHSRLQHIRHATCNCRSSLGRNRKDVHAYATSIFSQSVRDESTSSKGAAAGQAGALVCMVPPSARLCICTSTAWLLITRSQNPALFSTFCSFAVTPHRRSLARLFFRPTAPAAQASLPLPTVKPPQKPTRLLCFVLVLCRVFLLRLNCLMWSGQKGGTTTLKQSGCEFCSRETGGGAIK